MTRWTGVSALLLVLGGATLGLGHLLSDGGPTFGDGTALADVPLVVPDDPPPEGALRTPGTGPADASNADTRRAQGLPKDPAPSLVSRWRTAREKRRASLAKDVRRLTHTRGWKSAIERVNRIGKDARPTERLAGLQRILAATTDPIARQNLIFLAVLTLPTELSHPWLQSLRNGLDPADAEDALVALAFDGAEPAVADFAALATRAADAPVRRLLSRMGQFEAFARSGGTEVRRVLRSYRAIEVLDRKPYFKRIGALVELGWSAHPRPDDRAFARRIQEAWLARYPGHPGSDDVGWRIGRTFTAEGRHLDAARWYALASVLPDQDMTYPALRDLLVTCELFLTPEEVFQVSPHPHDPNFDLLDYVGLRRIAVSRGLDSALQHARLRAAAEPASLVGYAWNLRASTAPPKGLSSGETPVPAGDPLRATARRFPRPERSREVREKAEFLTSWYWRTRYLGDGETWRLNPTSQALAPYAPTVAAQLRGWETLHELARRERDARGPDRADWVYKQAAVHYHQPQLFFPAWDHANRSFPYLLAAYPMRPVLGELSGLHAARARFEQESYGPYHAIAHFDRLLRDHPDYAGADKARYSLGLSWRRLIDFWPFESAGADRPGADKNARIDEAVRALVGAFEALVRDHPESPLSGAARAAIAHWRSDRKRAFAR